MLTVKTFDDSFSAHIAGGMLDSEGIPYTILGEHDLKGPLFGGVRILVDGEHFERASELLDVAAPGDLACPECGSKQQTPQPFWARLLSLFANARSLPILAKRTCAQCEHSFRAY